MILLDAATKLLEIKLGGVVSANQLPFIATYADHTSTAFTPGASDGISNDANIVTLVAAPAGSTQRQVKQLSIFNDDTAAATVIVTYNNNGTRRQITEIEVPANGTLMYTDGEGWRVINSSGEVLTPGIDTTAFAEIAAAETISGAWTFTTAPKLNDNVKLLLGSGSDAAIYYDNADLYIDPREVGSGDLILVPNGGLIGVGTDSPIVDIHILKATNLPVIRVETSQADGTALFDIRIPTGTGNALTRYFNSGGTGFGLGFDDADNSFKIAGTANPDLGDTTRLTINPAGLLGIGEDAPGTLLDMAGTAPYLTLHNTTHEDGDGGRESRSIFEGEQSGGELTALGWAEFSHDGAADDEKGKFRLYLNDGNDGAAPTLRFEIDSTGLISYGVDRTAATVAGNFSADFWMLFKDSSGNNFYVPGMNALW